ncbi:putative sortase family protein [Actinoplanes missouriensis 431]|uniref:Putative sortase family protein n=1 Tax=Actinoplanes missouriensis (strain ATCC 14538 / DSM 43046 / CBS 188.64 / JCM 3121 / NBRC 102363 / NCIMB 12654 / NRRL B-3342 / UNCC 431) TaxID=512565 RepID=I0H776_ACTM4|nr:class F sortase [Actinoplanes missouriensis]BAL88863.1 putative sortase family protein [Actinoplanes missouriensis 431]
MPQIRDRRAAGLAVLLAVLGAASTAMGLQSEAATPAPVAAEPARQEPSKNTTSIRPAPTTPGTRPATATGGAASDDSVPAPPPASATPRKAAPGSLARSEPVKLAISRIGLDTAVSRLGLRRDGTLEVPPLTADAPAGWYRHSPTPGEPGAAVIIGHVDSAREGPAVFFRLREVRLGDPITVRRKNGTVATFEVYRVATYPKHAFPTDEVYGATDRPELRLITCGGSFDRSRGSYRDNVVVYASLRK